jgi:translation initiation factor IF-2
METQVKKVKIPSSVTVKKLAEILELSVSQVIQELLKNKILATINEEIDFETASIIAQDLGYTTEEETEEIGEGRMTLEKLLEICRREKE